MDRNKGLQGASYLEPRNRIRTSSSDSSGSSCGDSEGSQEKLRRLFQTCDSDGDGFIDGQDIYLMCRELNMEDSVHDLMVQLGADRHGRISFEEFLRCQRKLRGEIRSVTESSQPSDHHRGSISADELYQDRLQRAGSPKMGSNSSLPRSNSSLPRSNSSLPRSGHLGSWPASSDNSLGASSSTARDSWERDSGARDLSPEPGTFLQKLMDSATAAGGGANFLELANTLHLAALSSLKGEIIELSNRLQKVTSERDSFEKRLTKAQLERARYMQDNDDRLDQQAVRYEERITELHSVIAELNKKIDRSHSNAIQEEEEFSHSASSPPSNMSNSGGSCNGSSCHDSDSAANMDPCNDLGAELSRVVGELECAMEGRKVGDVFRKHIESAEHEVEKLTEASEDIKQRTLQAVQEVESLDMDSTEAHSPQSHRTTPNGHFNHHQLHLETRRRSSLEQEVTLLRDENETLNSSLSMKEEEMHKLKASFMGIRDERDKLRKKVRELQSILHANNQKLGGYTSSSSAEQLNSPNPRHSPRHSPGPSPSQSAQNVNPSTGELSLTGSDRRTDIPVAKVAERVRLKPSRSASSSSRSSSDRCVLGSDISSIGITNPKVAEHLAQTLQSCSSMQEILQTLSSYGLSIPEHKAREIEVDLERLTSKIEHLRCQNDVLQLSLEESKSNADRLTMLVGKYESNNTALQLAVNYSEQTIEAQEVVLALKESEQSVLLANCKAAGVGLESSEGSGEDSEETSSMLKRVHDNRKVSENVAKALLQRLDRSCGTMVCHVPLQPWEDLSSHSHTSTTSSTASSCDTEFSREDEQRLRDYIQQLKNDRAAVRLTVMELESVYVDPFSQESTPSGDSQRLDLENAVLMQELTALKEEKAELKAQYYLLDKEKKTLELKLSSREAQEQAYRVQIDHLKSEVKDSLSSPWEEQSSSLGRHRIDVMMRNGKVEMDHHSRQGSTSSSGGGPGGCGGGGGGSGGTTPAITLAELSMLEDPSLQVNAAEMLRREKRLKARIQELVLTLEKLQKNSEMRHQQSAEFVADLKRANSALVTAYEKAKKKHQSRLKKLEAQMMAMVERHDTQVRMLKQRIALLEEENHASRPPHNETSL